MRILTLAQLFLVFLAALAVPKNRTIDDTYGDSVTGEVPVYWHTWNASPCAQCSVQPDLSKAFQGTWHSTTSVNTRDWMSVNLTFTGTAIYIFAIFANVIAEAPDFATQMHITFMIDGYGIPEPFVRKPDDSNNLYYNQLIYSNTSLDNQRHDIVVTSLAADDQDDGHTFFIFDYAVYTVDEQATTGQTSEFHSQSPITSASDSATVSTVSSSIASRDSQISSTSATSSSSGADYKSTDLQSSFHGSSIFTSSVQSTSPVANTSSYTPSNRPEKPATGPIVGGVVGVAAFCLVLAAFLYRRHVRRQQHPERGRPQTSSTASLIDFGDSLQQPQDTGSTQQSGQAGPSHSEYASPATKRKAPLMHQSFREPPPSSQRHEKITRRIFGQQIQVHRTPDVMVERVDDSLPPSPPTPVLVSNLKEAGDSSPSSLGTGDTRLEHRASVSGDEPERQVPNLHIERVEINQPPPAYKP